MYKEEDSDVTPGSEVIVKEGRAQAEGRQGHQQRHGALRRGQRRI